MKIIRPEKSFRVKTDGFYGDFYRASHNSYTGKALIAFGGSAGTKQINRLLAGSFCDAGMDVMVIEYHGQEGLPKDLQNQPVETVERFTSQQQTVTAKQRGYKNCHLDLIYQQCLHYIL